MSFASDKSLEECPTCKDNLRILDLVPPVSSAEVKTAYLDLAKVWHPDRFQGDARLSAKAEEQFKRVQAAYQALLTHLPSHTLENNRAKPGRGQSPAAERSAQTSTGWLHDVLAQFHDGRRIFVASRPYPAYISDALRSYFGLLSEPPLQGMVGVADTTTKGHGEVDGWGPPYIVFSPRGLLVATVPLFGKAFLDTVDYAALTSTHVQYVYTQPPLEPGFFDRLAIALGLDPAPKPFTPEVNGVALGDRRICGQLSREDCERMRGALLALGQASRGR